MCVRTFALNLEPAPLEFHIEAVGVVKAYSTQLIQNMNLHQDLDF